MSVSVKRTFLLSLPLLALALGLLLGELPSRAQKARVGFDFKFPYYEGNSPRPSSLVLGKKATRRSDGLLLIEGLMIVSFEYDERNAAATNMLIEAPTCLLDLKKRVASSDGRLSARVPDGSFSIEGIGFEYRQVDSQLRISNQVSTQLKRPNLKFNPAQNAK